MTPVARFRTRPTPTARPGCRVRLGLERLDLRCLPSASPNLSDALEPGDLTASSQTVSTLATLPPAAPAFDGLVAVVPAGLAAGRTAVVDWGDGVSTPAALSDAGNGFATVTTARDETPDQTLHIS